VSTARDALRAKSGTGSMQTAPSLIDELESTMRQGSAAQRAAVLHRITGLFLHHGPACNEEQVALFDQVMLRLVDRIEQKALVELSTQLAPVKNAPTGVVYRLASDDDIEVSRPVIQESHVLTDEALVEIARSKSQEHLAAIAGRPYVAEKVTDILVERGDQTVTLKITQNHGARFSRHALMTVASRANNDVDLAETMVRRQDVPPDVFEHLLTKATEVVRQRLFKDAEPEVRTRINQILADIAEQVAQTEARQSGDGRAAASPFQDILRLKLQIGDFARAGRRQETMLALAALSKLPMEAVQSLLHAEAEDAVLILCKTIGLDWSDVQAVLAVMTNQRGNDPAKTKQAFKKYFSLTDETALRVINFVKACKAVSKADLQRML
jgi:uncharacterized protein (DUF2336 family)